MRRSAAIYTTLAVIFVLLYWRKLLLLGMAPFDGDILFFFYPSWAIGKRLLTEGFSLLWDPYRNMGQPFLASPQNQALYPLRLLSPFVDFVDYERIFILVHTFLAAAFSFLIGEKLWADRKAGCLMALLIAFGGYAYWRVLYQSDFATMAWVPAILYFYIGQRTVPLAFCLALQWLAGFPPFFILTQFILIGFALAQKPAERNLICLAKAWLFTAGLAAFQIFPFIALLKECDRPIFLDKSLAAHGAIQFTTLLRQILIPSVLLKVPSVSIGIQGFYWGPFITGLFIFGFWKSPGRQRWLGIFPLLALILATGDQFFPYSRIPGITIFRYPAHWLLVAVIFTGIVAARGLASLKSSLLKFILIGLVALDFLIFTTHVDFGWANRAFFTQARSESPLMKVADPTHRIYHSWPILFGKQTWDHNSWEAWAFLQDILAPSFGTSFGFREAFSHYSLTSKRALSYLGQVEQDSSVSLASFADIGTLVKLKPGHENVHRPTWQDIDIQVNPEAKGRVYFSEGSGAVTVLEDRPGKIIVKTRDAGNLVLSEMYVPEWKIKIDDKDAKGTLFKDTFPSVDIPGNNHTIEFKYVSRPFQVGLVISLLTLIFIGLFSQTSQTKQP